MTSINAIRFDNFSGAMACDEQRHWNEERLKLYAADKIMSVVPDDITRKHGIVAAYANTGSSGIGDELRLTIRRTVETEYKNLLDPEGKLPEKFIDMDGLADLVFGVITKVKQIHINDSLSAKFGFSADDLSSGKYKSAGGERRPISGKGILKKALDESAPDPSKPAAGPVFGNMGILAGYEPELGFRIYLFSMKEHFREVASDGFTCQGSGGDSASSVLADFFSKIPGGRPGRENLDRIEGLVALISALNAACRHNLGVGGYPNILLFDGKTPDPGDMLRQVNHHGSKLASEAVYLFTSGMLGEETVRTVVDGIFFNRRDISEIEERMWGGVENKLKAHRFLRGYP